MIKLIAVQPEVMGSPEFLREYFKDFGTSNGRWIPLIPQDWKKRVSAMLKQEPNLRPIERNAFRDKITGPKFRDRFVKVPEIEGAADCWEEVVLREIESAQIDAAIVVNNPTEEERMLVAGAFDPDCEYYAVSASRIIEREPTALFEPMKRMIQHATDLSIVDCYCLSQGSSATAYGQFFERIFSFVRVHNPSLRTVSLYRKRETELNPEIEKHNYESWLGPILQEGECVKIHYLRERPGGERLHLRAVFTEHCLGSGHYGFGGGDGSTTDFVLRNKEEHQLIQSQYQNSETRAFDLNETEILEIRSVSE